MSAASRLRRPWSSDARDAVGRICVAVLDAYADLHRQGVFHGDVHPRNLLFDDTAGQRARPVDFGLAVLASDAGRAGDERRDPRLPTAGVRGSDATTTARRRPSAPRASSTRSRRFSSSC